MRCSRTKTRESFMTSMVKRASRMEEVVAAWMIFLACSWAVEEEVLPARSR